MKNKYKNKFIENEIKSSYLNYAISVIVDRALPDIRDGLKPVHRRILYSMYLLNNLHNKKYKKSARIVGDVIGKYHPHGDIAVYDSIVRMAQNFSLRYPLIKGQGNFGSIDGDSAAAMRYTEIKMSKISEELLKDIDKNTVNFIKNYDNTEYIPEILPLKIPNVLINGSHGIAVGVATNIPPHNINEIMNACIKILDNKYITTEEIMNDIIGPDFPTGGIIKGKKNILEAYKNGKGKISLYSKIKIENNNIIILEIPYQVNKLKLIEKIIELIKNKEIIGISNINDESDKDGLRIVIEVKKEFSCYKILNNLYINTQLKINFGINMIAIKNNKPKLFTLKKILLSYINHRKNIILKKSNFLFKNNINKINKLISIIIAIYNIKYIINIITNSKTIEIVKKYFINKEFNIIHNYNNINNNIFINYLIKNNILINKNLIKLKDEQIDIILNLRLNKLINLEYEKILYKFIKNINENDKLYLILNNKKELINEIKNELIYIKNEYSDKRLTKIIDQDINIKKKI
ncbi:DNA gyrase subunit A [Candidatus Nardonella dryophthoridicola]|uniref:Topo IIA-type catalytic domain-containing protein n=1 Tax=endosymbiont of Metamasius hemipterus TaxID=204627 RepID=A0ABT0TW32_9GAMM|nr:DNA gyrase subunit A [Candidatus Nardonella dryophthoridicola]MCM0158213.1 hypothetical protein [endosymbiont of Metamasius hemipterus]